MEPTVPFDRYRSLPGVAAADFASAVPDVLAHLQHELGFALWMITRTVEEDWIVLASRDDHYGIEPGAVLRWGESVCYRMVRGRGPNVAVDLDAEPAYKSVFMRRVYGIGAYIGAPMRSADGALLGTLCAWDPSPQPEAVAERFPLVELQTRLLTTMLNLELRTRDAERRVLQLVTDTLHDQQTGVLGPSAWLEVLEAEEVRCRRYGSPATLAVVRATACPGDVETARRTARVLSTTCRASDHVARIDEHTFAVLVVEADHTKSPRVQQRLSSALHSAGIDAFVGVAVRRPGDEGGGLTAAFERALAYQEGSARARELEARSALLQED